MSSSATQFSLGNASVTGGGYKKPKDQEESMALMGALRSRSENKKCFDCPASTPEWCSIPFGIFLCLECCGRHRGMGVHISFMKSATMDAWQPDEAYRMSKGGNGAAAEYFRQHGLNEAKNRYTSMAAQMYKKRLDKIVAEGTSGGPSDLSVAQQSLGGSPNTPTATTTDFVASSPVEKSFKEGGSTTILSFNKSGGGASTSTSGISSPTGTTTTSAPVAISTTKVSLLGKKPTATGKTALAKKKGLGLGGVHKVDKLEEASGMGVSKNLIGGDDETVAPEASSASSFRSMNEPPKRIKTLNGGFVTPTPTNNNTMGPSSSFGGDSSYGNGGGAAPIVYRTGNHTGGGPDYGGIGSTPANQSNNGGGDGFRDMMYGIGQSFQSLKKKAEAAGNAAAQMLDEQ